MVVTHTNSILYPTVGHPDWFCGRGGREGHQRLWVYGGAGSRDPRSPPCGSAQSQLRKGYVL